jgi:hypothetical protein
MVPNPLATDQLENLGTARPQTPRRSPRQAFGGNPATPQGGKQTKSKALTNPQSFSYEVSHLRGYGSQLRAGRTGSAFTLTLPATFCTEGSAHSSCPHERSGCFRLEQQLPDGILFPLGVARPFHGDAKTRASDTVAPIAEPIPGFTHQLAEAPTSFLWDQRALPRTPQKWHFHMGFWTRTKRPFWGIAIPPFYGNGERSAKEPTLTY